MAVLCFEKKEYPRYAHWLKACDLEVVRQCVSGFTVRPAPPHPIFEAEMKSRQQKLILRLDRLQKATGVTSQQPPSFTLSISRKCTVIYLVLKLAKA